MARNSRIPQSKGVLFCHTGSSTGFRLWKLQWGQTIPLCVQDVVCLLPALPVQDSGLGARAVCSLSLVVSCHPPSTGAGALGCLLLRMGFIWDGVYLGDGVYFVWCLFLLFWGQWMCRGTQRPLGHGTSLTGNQAWSQRERGQKIMR